MKLSFRNFIIPALFILLFGFTSCTPETPSPPPINPAEQFVGSYRVDWNSEWTVYPEDTTEYTNGVDTFDVTLGSVDSSVVIYGTQIDISKNASGNYQGLEVLSSWGMYGSAFGVTFFGEDSISCAYHSTATGYSLHKTYLGKKL